MNNNKNNNQDNSNDNDDNNNDSNNNNNNNNNDINDNNNNIISITKNKLKIQNDGLIVYSSTISFTINSFFCSLNALEISKIAINVSKYAGKKEEMYMQIQQKYFSSLNNTNLNSTKNIFNENLFQGKDNFFALNILLQKFSLTCFYTNFIIMKFFIFLTENFILLVSQD